ncbi:hypothetical protein ZOSMA_194G00030 [Zostera marina]|uniref:Uncharacterized protein n=1 Tax=Zostera marina TaxID=29655 RepID=A0A0K9PR86_ZOSMR|nr:hypothetical protein ZOSMA_194G00030 [Zostera marina]
MRSPPYGLAYPSEMYHPTPFSPNPFYTNFQPYATPTYSPTPLYNPQTTMLSISQRLSRLKELVNRILGCLNPTSFNSTPPFSVPIDINQSSRYTDAEEASSEEQSLEEGEQVGGEAEARIVLQKIEGEDRKHAAYVQGIFKGEIIKVLIDSRVNLNYVRSPLAQRMGVEIDNTENILIAKDEAVVSCPRVCHSEFLQLDNTVLKVDLHVMLFQGADIILGKALIDTFEEVTFDVTNSRTFLRECLVRVRKTY